MRTLPRLARLGRLQPHTRVSLGGLMAEQANRAPEEECFLFEDRVHTNAAVDHRIDDAVRGLIAVGIRQGAHIGVLMDTSPSAVTAIAALSRLGAVAVLLPPTMTSLPPSSCVRWPTSSRTHTIWRRPPRPAPGCSSSVTAAPRTSPDGVGPGRRAGPPRPVRCAAAAVVSAEPGPGK